MTGTPRAGALEVERLGYRYAGRTGGPPALHDISFTVADGELVTIVGASGSGKSTLLRCIAGLLSPTTGRIRLHGAEVHGVPDDMAIVFQDYGRSLFGWLTVRGNVELPLRHRDMPSAERRARADAAIAEVGLTAQADRHPWELSGGMQQRVAIARALACRPELLLMDEPFGSVDAQTRADLQDQLLAIWAAHGTTILLVTHDIDEAVYLADRVLVLSRPPTSVDTEVPVPLPRPRDQVETRGLPAFVVTRTAVARRIHRPPDAAATQQSST